MAKSAGTALVTGGARRIGEAICRDLAAHGFAVAVHCNRSREEAEILAADIRAGGGQAAVVQADLSDMHAAAGVVDAAAKALGPIGLVVNNASVFEEDSLLDLDMESWDLHFDVHLKAPSVIASRFAMRLPPASEGLIVNIIDQRVLKPTPRYYSYMLSKSALWTATRTMAQALAPRIRVNAIGPGPALASSRQDHGDFSAQVDRLLLRRGPELTEFGATVRYLWQNRSVTGQMIALDGGQHLAWQTPDVTGIVE